MFCDFQTPCELNKLDLKDLSENEVIDDFCLLLVHLILFWKLFIFKGVKEWQTSWRRSGGVTELDNVMLRGGSKARRVPLYSQPPKLSVLAIFLLYISLRDTLGFLTPRDHKILLLCAEVLVVTSVVTWMAFLVVYVIPPIVIQSLCG